MAFLPIRMGANQYQNYPAEPDITAGDPRLFDGGYFMRELRRQQQQQNQPNGGPPATDGRRNAPAPIRPPPARGGVDVAPHAPLPRNADVTFEAMRFGTQGAGELYTQMINGAEPPVIDKQHWIEGGQLDELEGKYRPPLPPKTTKMLSDFLYEGEVLDANEMTQTEDSEIPAYIEPIPYEGVFIPEKVTQIPVCPTWQMIVTEQERNVNVKLYNFSICRPDFTHVVYGKRRTGKTHYVWSLMKAMRPYYPEVYVFTETKIDAEYEKMVPRKYIFDGYREDVLEHLMKRQEMRVLDMRKRGVNDENIYILIILDDCIGADELKNSKMIRRAFFNGRHLYMSIVINSQDNKALGPNIRANTDMVACFRVRSERDKEAVRTNFVDFVKNDDEFSELANAVGSIPYNIMFIDQARPYMPPEETIYCGVMPDKDDLFPFFMGSRSFWTDSFSQLIKHGGEVLTTEDDWGLVGETYAFAMHDDTKQLKLPNKGRVPVASAFWDYAEDEDRAAAKRQKQEAKAAAKGKKK